MQNFRETLEECNLVDRDHREDYFTWSNKHSDETFTKKMHDRAVANQSWAKLYDDFWVESLVAKSSDHKPIIV